MNLRGLNRVLVISSMIGSEDREDEIAAYRKRILRHRKAFGVDSLAEVRTVLFQTEFCEDCYQDIASDSKINKELLLGVMEKYKNINRSLDLYIESLGERIKKENEARGNVF